MNSTLENSGDSFLTTARLPLEALHHQAHSSETTATSTFLPQPSTPSSDVQTLHLPLKCLIEPQIKEATIHLSHPGDEMDANQARHERQVNIPSHVCPVLTVFGILMLSLLCSATL